MKSYETKQDESTAPARKLPRYKKHPVFCWRCYAKTNAPPRDKRPSRAFRRICEHCAGWRVLDAKERRAQGRTAFLPARLRPKEDETIDDLWADEELDEECEEASEEDYKPAENLDPLRDYTYWLQHEQAQKKKDKP